jgi:hypothetical protein
MAEEGLLRSSFDDKRAAMKRKLEDCGNHMSETLFKLSRGALTQLTFALRPLKFQG